MESQKSVRVTETSWKIGEATKINHKIKMEFKDWNKQVNDLLNTPTTNNQVKALKLILWGLQIQLKKLITK